MELKQMQTDKLIQMYANAKATSSCGGHYKGTMNDNLQKKYAEELEERGIIVPKGVWEYGEVQPSIELPEGVYNGEGSF